MSIYKDCDIRGIYGEEFDASQMYLVGRAIGQLISGRSIVVAGDVRVSTPAIKEQLLRGLIQEKAHITDIGTVPTPVAYFAKSRECFNTYALAIVTASHNPAKYNGIKLMFGEYPPTPEEIKSIEQKVILMDAGKAPEEPPYYDGAGLLEAADVKNLYYAYIKKRVSRVHGLKVVLDIGNGTTAGIAPQLYRELGYDVVELFGEPDGSFPNRNPNPADFNNLKALCAKVVETGADFGVAFDGDGDRAVFVDDLGRPVINEKSLIFMTRRAVTGMYASDVQKTGFSVVYDQKCSRIVPQTIKEMGGEAILERSGHAFIKKKFLKTGSIAAGEISGHFFFKELGHDDGIYAGLCMGEFIEMQYSLTETASSPHKGLSLSDMADTLPTPFISPDLRYRVRYQQMDGILESIKTHYEGLGMPVSTYDGVRVCMPDGWLLVRKSVTEEAMTVKIESVSDERIDELKKELERTYFE